MTFLVITLIVNRLFGWTPYCLQVGCVFYFYSLPDLFVAKMPKCFTLKFLLLVTVFIGVAAAIPKPDEKEKKERTLEKVSSWFRSCIQYY